MTITFFSTQPYDKAFFTAANKQFGYTLVFHTHALSPATAATVNGGVVCIFVNDGCNAEVVEILARQGVTLVALRCAGYNNIDAVAVANHGIAVVRVPAYSPQAVAEHAVALLMTLNRKTHKAYNRVREQNFALNGLMGFDVYGKTVGVVGTGNIGQAFCRIMLGFGCRVLAFDVVANVQMQQMGVQYVDLGTLFAESDIISLHCPL
ncbi:MAG: 2-hydroxyacid dehydrogenase, partial [Bacteroidetes bacterium]